MFTSISFGTRFRGGALWSASQQVLKVRGVSSSVEGRLAPKFLVPGFTESESRDGEGNRTTHAA